MRPARSRSPRSTGSWTAQNLASGEHEPNPTTPQLVDSTHLRTTYIDVVLAATGGRSVDTSTVGSNDLTISDPGVTVSAAVAPTQLPGTSIFRYYLDGNFLLGAKTVTFSAGSWSDTAGPSSASQATFTVVAPRATVDAPFPNDSADVAVVNGDLDSGSLYIDVSFHPTPGNGLDYASIFDSGDEFTVTANGSPLAFSGTPVAITLSPDPGDGRLVATTFDRNSGESDADYYARLADAGVTRMRYTATSSTARYAPGTVTIDFLAYAGEEGWRDSGGNESLATEDDLTKRLDGPTAVIVNPGAGASVDINALNNRNWIDVTYDPAPAGYALVGSSITDLAPEFALSGPGVGTAALDLSQAPKVLPSGAVRYWLTGAFAAGDVQLDFIPGSWSYTSTAAPDGTTNVGDVTFLDVTFPTPPDGFTLNAGSITDAGAEFTLSAPSGKTISVNTSVAPVVDSIDPNTFRFAITGTIEVGDEIGVDFTDATWEILNGPLPSLDRGRSQRHEHPELPRRDLPADRRRHGRHEPRSTAASSR